MVQLLISVVGAYAVIAGLMFALQRKLIYRPDRTRSSPAAAGAPEMAPVEYETADGLRLTSWLAAPRASQGPLLVYLQGNAGSIADRADKVRPFLASGIGVLLVSYRGYGGNPGRPSETGLLNDGRAALDHLVHIGIAPDRTILYGESLGSGVAVALAAERPLGALVLEAPFTSIVDVAASAYPWLPVRFAMIDRFNSLARIKLVGAPKLILHGERDSTVPVHLGRRLLDHAEEPKQGRFYAAAGHTDLHDHGAVDDIFLFLEEVGLGGQIDRS
ncbi:MAG: alpha/beta hydrolase [Alphaproteobacteria bacterium]|nr:alpha/beta hydrolase [Alphaproteobacteria bacterium]